MNWRKWVDEKPEEYKNILIMDKAGWAIGVVRNNTLIYDDDEYEMCESDYWIPFEELEATLPKE